VESFSGEESCRGGIDELLDVDVELSFSVEICSQNACVKPRQKKTRKSPTSLVYCLAMVVSMCILILFSMMQRMASQTTLHDLMSALLKAEFEQDMVLEGVVDMHGHHLSALGVLPVERKILGTLYTQLLNKRVKFLVEIMKGAHVIVEQDDGWYYDKFRNLSSSTYARISSHFSSEQQYAIPQGYMLDTLLTGKTSGQDSWFQLEGANWDPFYRPFDSFVHVLNYIEYRIRGVQIGPLGTSVHTDKNPLRIPFSAFQSTRQFASDSTA